jgi:hypothetical protein
MPEHISDREPSEAPGGLPQERVEVRPNVGTTTPEQYPNAEDKDASGSGRLAGRDDEMENERLNPGSGHGGTPSSAHPAKRDQFNGGEA